MLDPLDMTLLMQKYPQKSCSHMCLQLMWWNSSGCCCRWLQYVKTVKKWGWCGDKGTKQVVECWKWYDEICCTRPSWRIQWLLFQYPFVQLPWSMNIIFVYWSVASWWMKESTFGLSSWSRQATGDIWHGTPSFMANASWEIAILIQVLAFDSSKWWYD